MLSVKIVISLFVILQIESVILQVVTTSKPQYNQYEPTFSPLLETDTCAGVNCVGLGDTCTNDMMDYSLIPCTGKDGEKCCQYGLYCVLNNDTGSACAKGEYMQSIGNAGDSCSSNSDCDPTNNLQCSGGKCAGIPIGQKCVTSSLGAPVNPCVFGSQCWNGLCAETIPNGKPCSVLQCTNNNTGSSPSSVFDCDQCGYGSYCDLTSNTCAKRYTKFLGVACVPYDFPCDTSLACVYNKMNKGKSGYACSRVSQAVDISATCTSDSTALAECGNDTVCACNNLVGKNQCFSNVSTVASTHCVEMIQSFQKCATKHSCQDPARRYTQYDVKNDCALQNCWTEYSDVEACACNFKLKNRFGSCLYDSDNICKYQKFKQWKAALLITGICIPFLVTGLAIIGGLIKRKPKSQYQAINSY